ncbi:uncharacterized protein BJ171DRAFT_472349 [Polychytrium aggregatum]|uniref:uncharacterized protein n=1 Tax=Polychytrium aggregatum TaxID=110093 RepID=UPI0022FE18FE|nr:uncharacterized protein BJ171DRAFT_472349 [Polychytrium aggregatum]KAI9207453.1 hypothetical protein BJ171DRAFT_472349 [Polychytrium aggregatum]
MLVAKALPLLVFALSALASPLPQGNRDNSDPAQLPAAPQYRKRFVYGAQALEGSTSSSSSSSSAPSSDFSNDVPFGDDLEQQFSQTNQDGNYVYDSADNANFGDSFSQNFVVDDDSNYASAPMGDAPSQPGWIEDPNDQPQQSSSSSSQVHESQFLASPPMGDDSSKPNWVEDPNDLPAPSSKSFVDASLDVPMGDNLSSSTNSTSDNTQGEKPSSSTSYTTIGLYSLGGASLVGAAAVVGFRYRRHLKYQSLDSVPSVNGSLRPRKDSKRRKHVKTKLRESWSAKMLAKINGSDGSGGFSYNGGVLGVKPRSSSKPIDPDEIYVSGKKLKSSKKQAPPAKTLWAADDIEEDEADDIIAPPANAASLSGGSYQNSRRGSLAALTALAKLDEATQKKAQDGRKG